MDNEAVMIQQKSNALVDQSLDATRRMNNMASEIKNIGISTLQELDEQGEKLDHIEKNQDQMNENIKNAEKALNQMEKCCGLCSLKRKKKVIDAYAKVGAKNSDLVQNKTTANNYNNKIKPNNDGPIMKRVLNDHREDEMEENLKSVNNVVGDLKNMALDMGNKITVQNEQIDRIAQKASVNNEKIQDANKRANKLLK